MTWVSKVFSSFSGPGHQLCPKWESGAHCSVWHCKRQRAVLGFSHLAISFSSVCVLKKGICNSVLVEHRGLRQSCVCPGAWRKSPRIDHTGCKPLCFGEVEYTWNKWLLVSLQTGGTLVSHLSIRLFLPSVGAGTSCLLITQTSWISAYFPRSRDWVRASLLIALTTELDLGNVCLQHFPLNESV